MKKKTKDILRKIVNIGIALILLGSIIIPIVVTLLAF